MGWDDDISEFIKRLSDYLLKDFVEGTADYAEISKKIDEIESILQGKVTYGIFSVDDDGIHFSGSMPPGELVDIFSKLFGERFSSSIEAIYKQERQPLVHSQTIEVMEEEGLYRILAELGPLYSPDCEHSIEARHGTISLEFKCEKKELSGVIDLRDRLGEEYYEGKLELISYHITNNVLDALVKKV